MDRTDKEFSKAGKAVRPKVVLNVEMDEDDGRFGPEKGDGCFGRSPSPDENDGRFGPSRPDEHMDDEATVSKAMSGPVKPTAKMVEDHNVSHLPFRNWCSSCV